MTKPNRRSMNSWPAARGLSRERRATAPFRSPFSSSLESRLRRKSARPVGHGAKVLVSVCSPAAQIRMRIEILKDRVIYPRKQLPHGIERPLRLTVHFRHRLDENRQGVVTSVLGGTVH